VLLDLLLIGLAITLEPLQNIAMILILGAKRGTMKGLAFIFGWMGSLLIIVAAVVVILDGKPLKPSTAPSTAALAVKLALGVLLLYIAFRQQKKRGQPRKPAAWEAKLDGMSPFAAAGLAVLLQPWTLVAAGVATVTEAKVSNIEEDLLLFLFCILCTSTILAMEIYATFAPEAARVRLNAIRNWIDTHRDQAIIGLSLVLGLWLIGHSIYGLVSAS
jgi:threonine/homoserine/homoserine lactone efflux protein